MPVVAAAVTAIVSFVASNAAIILVTGAAIAYGIMSANKVGRPNFGSVGGGTAGSPRYGFGALQNTTSSELPLPILYGELVMYGNNIYQSEPGETVDRAIALCEGDVNSITAVKVNDTAIGDIDGCSYTAYTGTSTQTIDSRLTGEVYGLRHTAYLAVTLKSGDKLKGGNPTVSCLIQGTKVRTWDGYVWRATKTYSNNPAACILDFLTNDRYRCGLADSDIDLDSFGSVYEYCNQQVDNNDGGTENRFELDFVIDSHRSQIDILGDILATFSGFLVWNQGKLYLRVEKSETPVQNFSEDNVILDSASYSIIDKDQLLNRVKVLFIDPNSEYTKVFAIAEDLNDQDLRSSLEGGRGIISTEASLLGITRQSQALRMANYYLKTSRKNGTVLNFKTSIEAVHCEPGDVISVTLPDFNWTNKLFRIVTIKETEDDERELTCKEHYNDVYTDSYGAGLSSMDMPTTPITEYENKPLPNVGSVTIAESNYLNKDGTYCSDIDATWDALAEGGEYFSHYIVELKKGGEDYIEVGVTQDTNFTIADVETNITYYVRIKVANKNGYISSGTVSNPLTVSGKAGSPSNVGNFQNTFTDEIKLTWDAVTDPDLWGYELRTNDTVWSSGDVSNLVWRGNADNYTIVRPSSRTPGTYYIRAIDRSGNYSLASASTTPTNTAPDAPTISAEIWFGYGKLEWNDSMDSDLLHYDVYVSRNNTWGSGDDYLEARVKGTECIIQGDSPVVGSGDSGGSNYLQSTSLIGSGDSRFEGDSVVISRGTGVGQTKTVVGYDSSIGRITGDTVWDVNPDATSEWMITDNRYYRVCGVDSFGSGDFSNIVGVPYVTLTEDQLGDEIIRARNIYAGEVITLSAQIRDAIINNAHIIDLSVEKLTSGTINSAEIIIGSGGQIVSENYVSGDSGFRLDDTYGLEVWSGFIQGSVIVENTIPVDRIQAFQGEVFKIALIANLLFGDDGGGKQT